MQANDISKLIDMGAPDGAPELMWIDPNSITPNVKNWRIHTDDQRTLVSDLITDKGIGWADVCLYNKRTNEFVNGHLRREIAIQRGIDRIPVLVIDVSPEKQNVLHAALDLSTGMARPDPALLAEIVLKSAPPTPESDEILRRLAHRQGARFPESDEPEGTGDGDEADGASELSPEERLELLREKWGVERGQVWQVKSADNARLHRFMCGDCTNKSDVTTLMDGRSADLLFTSPPYGAQREYEGREFSWPDLMGGLVACLPVTDTAQVFFDLGLYYEEGEWVEYWQPLMQHMSARGWRKFGWYVWDQGSGMFGSWHGRLAPSHEFVFHFNKVERLPNKIVPCVGAGEVEILKRHKGPRHADGKTTGGTGIGGAYITADHKIADSVLRISRATSQGIAHLHPAIGSIALAQLIVESYTEPAQVVYEPFLGAGSTLLACELAGRACRSMEIEPTYVALTLERLSEAGHGPARA